MRVSGRVTSRIYFINKNIKALIYHSLSSKYNPCISVSTSSNEVLWSCSRACAHRGSWACARGSWPCTSGSWASFSATVFSGSKLIHSLVARGIVHGWMVPLIIDPACFTLCASFRCLDSVIASWSMACSLSFCFLSISAIRLFRLQAFVWDRIFCGGSHRVQYSHCTVSFASRTHVPSSFQ